MCVNSSLLLKLRPVNQLIPIRFVHDIKPIKPISQPSQPTSPFLTRSPLLPLPNLGNPPNIIRMRGKERVCDKRKTPNPHHQNKLPSVEGAKT